MNAMTITLPLPDPGLSPNARLHWAQKRKLVEQARYDGWIATMEVWRPMAPLPLPARIPLSLSFVVPDHRRRDLDNLVSSCKAYLDGVADALGVDDSRFDLASITRRIERGVREVRLEIPLDAITEVLR